MGNSASSDIIYGFNLSPEIIEDKDINFDRARAWEKHITAALVEPASYAVPHKQRTPEQVAEVQAWHAAREQRVADNAQIIHWGYSEGDDYAIGVHLVRGDWNAPADFGQTMLDHMANGTLDPDARVAELCAWLGIEPQPCTLLLLSSYG